MFELGLHLWNISTRTSKSAGKSQCEHSWNKRKQKEQKKKHFPFLCAWAYPCLVCFASVNIRETSRNNSAVVIGPHCACVFSVFLCLSHVCEHPFFMLVFVFVLLSQVRTRLKLFEHDESWRIKDGTMYNLPFAVWYGINLPWLEHTVSFT